MHVAQIEQGGTQVRVAQQLLQPQQIAAIVQIMYREGVPKSMWVNVTRLQPGFFDDPAQHKLYAAGADRLRFVVRIEQPFFGFYRPEITCSGCRARLHRKESPGAAHPCCRGE